LILLILLTLPFLRVQSDENISFHFNLKLESKAKASQAGDRFASQAINDEDFSEE
jgi:hypothetical protein